MFDRLQSLLVDVGEDEVRMSDKDTSDKECYLLSTGDNALDTSKASIFASDPRKEHPLSALTKDDGEGKVLLDLSKLTIDQRAYHSASCLGSCRRSASSIYSPIR